MEKIDENRTYYKIKNGSKNIFLLPFPNMLSLKNEQIQYVFYYQKVIEKDYKGYRIIGQQKIITNNYQLQALKQHINTISQEKIIYLPLPKRK